MSPSPEPSQKTPHPQGFKNGKPYEDSDDRIEADPPQDEAPTPDPPPEQDSGGSTASPPASDPRRAVRRRRIIQNSIAVVIGLLLVMWLMTTTQAYLDYSLRNAAAGGDLKALRGFILAGAEVNGLSSGGRESPLHLAAANGHVALVEELLESEASVDARTSNGNTALIDAASGLRIAALEVLLMRRADPLLRNDNGDTALSAALVSFRNSPPADLNLAQGDSAVDVLSEVVGLLLGHGADPTLENEQGETALDLAQSVLPTLTDPTERTKMQELIKRLQGGSSHSGQNR